ncbi:uncharacterized protein LOC143921973 [Arctopsyche grandis]|uniref:uncharacterized protein LOC143921973 n=1 Tax=Arctopsyche grandis TaxID=121162 RepID=UPI00406D90D4
MWTTKKLKERFLDFFEKRGHVRLPSSSVVPQNDPTLLFANSGMVQFKNIFLGEESKHKRVATSQRCIRAGGKHNDLDDVGKDNYHHTFFEMLGNWSFGDYFKEEAIEFAYDFLINELKLDKEKMYVTIYEEMDKESANIWRKYVDPSKIIPSSHKDNFWEMGEFGPCGPCTEIHYDRIGGRDASALVNKDDPTVIEIWNIVFMEYEKTPKGLEKLKIKNIDTGIGLERLLSILVDVPSNYLIDSFQHIIKFIESKCDFIYEDGNNTTDVAFRVLSDHARTISVCLNDRVVFSSEGVGYVLRRILRRAVRYAHDILKLSPGVISQCVNEAAKFMDLNIDVTIVDDEEKLFLNTLMKGLNKLIKIAETNGKLDGYDVFILYDTYGFPSDLTELVAKEKNIPYSLEGFNKYKLEAQELSKSNKKFITINFDFPKTNDSFKYTTNKLESNLSAIVLNNEIVNDIPQGETVDLIFDRTCFYGECGGQVGDIGIIEFFDGIKRVGVFNVENTQIQRGYVLHKGKLEGQLSSKGVLSFDEKNRALICANHSTVHILNYFLRNFIKTEQRGSYVDATKCRFDFNSKKLSDDILSSLEEKMNTFISSNATVRVTLHSKEEVIGDNSIICMDGEEYPDMVRVITMDNGKDLIKEICGGTHVSNTSQIKLIRILSESGVKANTRRIVAVSNEKAIEVDENAKNLRTAILTGEVIPFDTHLLSITQKKEIEFLNKENFRKKQQKFDDTLANLKIEIVNNLVQFKMSKLLETSIFSYECKTLADFSKKDVSKSLPSLLSLIEITGFIFVRFADQICFVAKCKELKSLMSSLTEVFPSNQSRIVKDCIQGTISTDEFSDEKLNSLFK